MVNKVNTKKIGFTSANDHFLSDPDVMNVAIVNEFHADGLLVFIETNSRYGRVEHYMKIRTIFRRSQKGTSRRESRAISRCCLRYGETRVSSAVQIDIRVSCEINGTDRISARAITRRTYLLPG